MPSSSRTVFVTAWEMFVDNNEASFTSYLDKLDGDIPLGSGISAPEPTDFAAAITVGTDNCCGLPSSLGQPMTIAGPLRANVAKYVIIITDDVPGSIFDTYSYQTTALIGQLISHGIANEIKYFVLGPGVNQGAGGQDWRNLADQTGGQWNASVDATIIESYIVADCT